MPTRTLPRFWPFLFSFVVLLVLWVPVLEMYMKPAALSTLSATPQRRLLWWLVPPVALVFGAFLLFCGLNAYKAHREAELARAEQQAKEDRERAEAAATLAQKDHDHYSLEVYGLGLELDDLTENSIWEALKRKAPHAVILRTDPKEYPWSKSEKGEPGSYAYETAIKEFPEKWELPFLLGGSALHDPGSPDYLKAGLAGARRGGGMHYHRFRTVSQTYDDYPDRLPGDLFGLFDQYPDLPAAAVAVEDSLGLRDMLNPPQAPSLLKNGYEIPELTTSCAVLLVGRRDRVELLRPTATEIPTPEIQIPFETDAKGMEFLRKSRSIKGEPPPTDYVVSYDDAPPEPIQPNYRGEPKPFWEMESGAPEAFKPSRFVKRPWSKEQLVQFDLLKVLARIHRPQTAEYVKDHKTLGPRDRQEAFLEAWRAALATLAEGEQPVRVIYDFGPKGAAHLPPLLHALREAGPDLDISGKDGIDVTASFRDTGANSLYVAMALGILGTEKEGGVSAIVNLRRPDRATILMISPPTEADKVRRKIHFQSKYMGTINQE